MAMNQHLEMHHGADGDAPAGAAIDPVCGMTVDPDTARAAGLSARHGDTEYFFCGRGCKLDFLEDPAKYLADDYRPQM
jgi:Cu+-exporting ATPase